jgi:ATP-dependent DNA helicase RecQ
MQAQETLRKYFGHEAFRPGQEVMVNALTHHRDALGVMPTGAGKSMCYQVPALMMPGVAIVISPLISLMADQVAALKSAGVPAAYLNSSLTPRQMDLAMQRARQGAYKIIYVAPERLETPSFQAMAQSMPISLLAVDEAHCVSQWGQDFRPVYLRIADFVDSLPTRPVMGAFTATATERVRQDIIRLLRLQNPETVTTGFDRPNLYFEVIRPKNRDAALMDILRRKRGESGIVYCATRKAVEQVCDNLIRAGIDATRYHAGLSDEERKENQEKFQYDTCPVMVATNAFGMGIDKSNVRFVIHYQMPRSMEAYYQEAGRAGRDGEAAECILLYNGSDIFTAKWMIEHTEPNENMTAAEQSAVRYQDMNRLNRMVDYCTKPGCLRAFILRYFGENAAQDCGHCSACCGARYGEAEEIARQRRRGAGDGSKGRQHRENRSPGRRRFVRAAAAGADGTGEAAPRSALHHLQRRDADGDGTAQAGDAGRNAERERHG